MALRNRLIDMLAAGCTPLWTSPEICVSALPSAGPVKANKPPKPPGRSPPALKKLLIEFATLCWF